MDYEYWSTVVVRKNMEISALREENAELKKRVAELEEALKEIIHSTRLSGDCGGCDDAYYEARKALGEEEGG